MAELRVAYTLEQCWHRVPGGTAVAALRVARELAVRSDVTILGVAGRHRAEPADPWSPPVPVAQLPLDGPWLYESWLRAGWPKVERATGKVDVAHATTIIPCPSVAPLVCTVHDLAFVHAPEQFTKHGARVFARSLRVLRERDALVLCSSSATATDCRAVGLTRLRVVPLGVDADPATAADVDRVRAAYRLPERFALFVGTIEPRKNLANLAAAMRQLPDLPLVVAGADGWGAAAPAGDVRFLGFVPQGDLAGLYAAATVFCYPSLREGYGLPVLEAMAQGTPVVTSRGTSTEEAAGGAAVLVAPGDPDDIASGVREALDRAAELAVAGRARAAGQTWARTAELTVAAYREAAA